MNDEYGYFTSSTTRQQYREYRKLARWWMSEQALSSGDNPGDPPNDVYWAFTTLFSPLDKDPLDCSADYKTLQPDVTPYIAYLKDRKNIPW